MKILFFCIFSFLCTKCTRKWGLYNQVVACKWLLWTFMAFPVRVSQHFRHFSLTSKDVCCYTIPTLVDRIVTATLLALRPVRHLWQGVSGFPTSDTLVLHIEYLSVSTAWSLCVQTFCMKGINSSIQNALEVLKRATLQVLIVGGT